MIIIKICILDYRISGVTVVSRMYELTYLMKYYGNLQKQSVTASETTYLLCLIEKLECSLLNIFNMFLA